MFTYAESLFGKDPDVAEDVCDHKVGGSPISCLVKMSLMILSVVFTVTFQLITLIELLLFGVDSAKKLQSDKLR